MEYFEHTVAGVFQFHCSLFNSMSKQNWGEETDYFNCRFQVSLQIYFLYELFHTFLQMYHIEQAGEAVMLKTSNPEGIRFESRPKSVRPNEAHNLTKFIRAIQHSRHKKGDKKQVPC